ncbi:hypothetical protein ZWY2020_009816 [Hordeum vulgare]|nr:hypothetical protein ZWY2020_009816 [Hordeum vulgare]
MAVTNSGTACPSAPPRRALHWAVALPPAPYHGRARAKPWPILSAHARPCQWPPDIDFFLLRPARQQLACKSASSVAFALDGDGGQGLVPQRARRRCVESRWRMPFVHLDGAPAAPPSWRRNALKRAPGKRGRGLRGARASSHTPGSTDSYNGALPSAADGGAVARWPSLLLTILDGCVVLSIQRVWPSNGRCDPWPQRRGRARDCCSVESQRNP